MTILITGGAGFIGSHLAERLLKQGQAVLILDNLDPYYDVQIKRANLQRLRGDVTVVEGDVRDGVLLERLFRQHRFTQVAHMGGLAGVRNSIEDGPLYAEVNTMGSVNLMNMARKYGVQEFVQASTSSVYGETDQVPFKEEHAPDSPLSPYPASKRSAEIFGYSYHHLFGLNITVLRFFNVYGPFGRPDMMPLKVIDALLKDKPITIYDEGKLERDWTYIDDIVDGIVLALQKPLGYQIFNLGCGAPIRLTRFIEIYEGLIGKRATLVNAPAPASEPRITYCDNTRARQFLGFEPRVQIEDGLARTWAWYQQRL